MPSVHGIVYLTMKDCRRRNVSCLRDTDIEGSLAFKQQVWSQAIGS